ncbi:carboxypeptidase-like regulatory domain-containing protein [Rubinisphaera italica]|uniref:Carboxypeptidase regulatory-like domain-containing protein n=1 Tax=Rubinisphaera italica TaxID=2527969 RepID=A0A5C5XAC9_9PLAN|nr:carboxypeptidase-like regulatory domain-containing protein [Rubinisphaera italica]TWT60117.1 hypothetical protein Pan54_08300 [Rubinisphaera italica]
MRQFQYLMLLSLMTITGCSKGSSDAPTLTTVSGVVVSKGQPLSGVILEFRPEKEGAPSYGTTNENGEFELNYSDGREGAVPGKHTVKMTESFAPAEADGGDGPPPKRPPGPPKEKTMKIDVKADASPIELSFD